MTAEVDWVLEQLADLGVDAPLRRVDRDESTVLEGDIRTRQGDLQDANFVGASFADRDVEAVGTEYDHRVETVVSLRIEGLTHEEWGHVDPDGEKGVPFDELVREIRTALLAQRGYPDVEGAAATYKDIIIGTESPDSAAYKDYYRHDLDLLFRGYEDLP